MRGGLKKLLLFSTLLIFPFKEINLKKNHSIIKEKNFNEMIWKNVSEYENFVKLIINKHYEEEIQYMYNFYNIKREIPKYGFKSKDIEFTCFDCEGAVYKEKVDSIYFYSKCSKEMLKNYLEYYKNEDLKNKLSERLKYYIRHEAAHAFYFDVGRKLKEDYLFLPRKSNIGPIENIKTNLISEGVAEYICHKGNLTPEAKKFNDSDLNKMVKEKDDFNLYYLGFVLVKPILDKNFEKGIIELIKNPLTKNDLNDLVKYREKILKKI